MTTLDEIKARPPIEVRCGHCNEDLSNARSVEIANENIAWLIAEVERQAQLIQMCAGLISTMDQFSNWLTEDVYRWVLNGMPEKPIDREVTE